MLAPDCDFTPDAACDLADINQMFLSGNLVTRVDVAGLTDGLDPVDNDTINAVARTEWLSQAATVNGHRFPYLRGDTDLDRNVDLADYSALASNFSPAGYGAVPEPASVCLLLAGLLFLARARV